MHLTKIITCLLSPIKFPRGWLVSMLGLVTIDPMMFLECMATQISTIPREQMILYKICRGNSSHLH